MSDVVYDVAIVGGGLAGLNAAIRCGDQGLKTVLFDAGAVPLGGKLQTDVDEDGFQYDHGFQVCFSAYEELTRIEYGRCRRYYAAGATIVGLGTLSAWNLLRTVRCHAIRVGDLLGFLRLVWLSRRWHSAPLDLSVRDVLHKCKFSESSIGSFFTPFYGGISLDRSLSGSGRQFLKTWNYLSKGRTFTYVNGIQGLPLWMDLDACYCDPIPEVIGERVLGVTQSNSGFVLQGDESYHARSVICAGGYSALSLVGIEAPAFSYKQSICLYFASDRPVTKEKYIILNPAPDALVNQVVPLSNVNPNCAPKRKHLCSATIIGERPESDEELAEMAITEMNSWGLNLPPLEFKRAYRIKEAQLQQEPGFEDRVPSIDTHLPGVFLAGEMTTSSSINDALKSGRLAAEAALAYLRNK